MNRAVRGNRGLRKPFGPANREQRQGMARDHEFLIGRNDVETDATISCGDRRGGCRIGLRIELAPKPGERLHDACSEGRRVLADSRGEHEGVEPPEGGSQQACMEPDPIDEIVEREARLRVGTRFQLAHVVAEAREALQSALAIQQVLNLCGGHVLFLDEVKHDAGIDLARPCPHRQAVKRGKAHRALDAAAARKRAHRCTAAQMGNDHAPGCNLWRHLRDRKSTRLNSSRLVISYAVFCLKKKKKNNKRSTIKNKKKKNTKI